MYSLNIYIHFVILIQAENADATVHVYTIYSIN